MISTNQFKNGMTIRLNGNIYAILSFQHVKPGKG
ncbi:MAG: elongation factor P, partial [Candidatus Omnitrophica bacterium]|nr:elongation factor P [Candidatus Omnitrophota bacterium]